MELKSTSAAQTRKLAANLAKKIKKLPCLVLLQGDLGAGKTEWAKGFIDAYLGKKTIVTSPSYSIVNGYENKSKKVFHVDLYRLSGVDDLESVGFWDLLAGKNVVVVEWGDRLPHQWPAKLNVVEVHFQVVSENERRLSVSSPGLKDSRGA